jgi:hypothetical protein
VRTLKKSFGVVWWIGAMSEERGRWLIQRGRGVEERNLGLFWEREE